MRAPKVQPTAGTTPMRLTERRMQTWKLLATGMTNKQIARSLGISEGATKIHVANVLRIAGAANRTGAAIEWHARNAA